MNELIRPNVFYNTKNIPTMRISTNIIFYTSFVHLQFYFWFVLLGFSWGISESKTNIKTNSNKSMIDIKIFLRCILPERVPLNYNMWGYLRPLWHINVYEPTIISLYNSTIIYSTPKYQYQASPIKESYWLMLWYRTLPRWKLDHMNFSYLFCWLVPSTVQPFSIYIVLYWTRK